MNKITTLHEYRVKDLNQSPKGLLSTPEEVEAEQDYYDHLRKSNFARDKRAKEQLVWLVITLVALLGLAAYAFSTMGNNVN